MSTIETVSSTYGGYMAKAKLVALCFDDGSTEEFTLGEDRGDCGDYISVRDESSYTEILISLENLDAFCDALKAFRDEVTKPKMTGGLGIKDDE